MAAVEDALVTKLDLIGLSAYTSGMERAAGALGLMDAATTKAQKRMLGFGLAAGAASLGIAAGLARAVKEAGKMQQAKAGFTTLLGSAEDARAKIKELQDFADRTPFSFESAQDGARMLLGMGASADQLIPILGALGNALSASGKGTEAFSRAIYAVSKILNKGKLSAEELNMLAEAGVPLKDVLSELGATMGEVGNKGISSERAIAALLKVLNQGRFAGAMAAQMDTLNGSASTLADSVQRLEASIGEGLIGPATAATQAATRLVDTLNALPGPVKAMAGVVAGGLAVALAGYSIATLLAIRRTILLAEAHLGAAAAARTHAAAEAQAAVAMAAGGAARAAGTAAGGAARAAGTAAGGAMTWRAFTKGKMGPYMKSEGGHAGAMARLSKEWAEYKAAQMGATAAAGAAAAGAGAAAAPAAAAAAATQGSGMGARALRMAKRLKAPGAALAATFAAEMLLGQLGNEGWQGDLKNFGQKTALGIGAGSPFGLPGMAIGGGIAASVATYQNIRKALGGGSEAAKEREPAVAQLEKQNEILRQQLEELKGIRRQGTPFDTRDMAAAYQWMAMRGARALA